jgi:hypothetical protein
MSNDETNYSEIELFGVFPSNFARPDLDNPLKLFQELYKETHRLVTDNRNKYEINTINIFKGIIDFDESFNNHLSIQILKLITKALKAAEKTVQGEIQWQEDLLKSKQVITTRVTIGQHSIIIDSLRELKLYN